MYDDDEGIYPTTCDHDEWICPHNETVVDGDGNESRDICRECAKNCPVCLREEQG